MKTQMPEDEPYKKAAELMYERTLSNLSFARQMQAEYGKWMINTLWLMHSGSIVGLLYKSTAGGPPVYLASLWWFVVGIVFAFASGFAAWWNFSFAIQIYDRWADVRMLEDRQRWPIKAKGEKCKVIATMWIAIATGIISIICLLGGAWSVVTNWKA